MTLFHRWLALWMGVLAVTASAQGDEPAPPPVSPREAAQALESVETLKLNYKEALRYYYARVMPMRTGRKKDEAHARYHPPIETWAERFWGLVASVPGTEAEARALAWIALEGAASARSPAAAQRLVDDHLERSILGHICSSGSAVNLPQLQRIWEASPHGEVRARAGFAMAERWFESAERAPGEDVQALQGKAIATLETIEKELAAIAIGGRTAGDLAADRLYVWRYLRTGMAAPKVLGVDLNGKLLSLPGDPAQHLRVLLFWRDREMTEVQGYGSVRTLHERFRARGVSLIGINCDANGARAKRVASLQGLPMPSMAAGAQGGEACRAYRVATWPNCVLVDAQGRLLRRGLAIDKLGQALEAELEVLETQGQGD